jgi:hypothetical protein
MSEYDPCKPKMEDYDVNVRVDVVGNLVIIGTQLNVTDLSKDRRFLKYRNVVTIKVSSGLSGLSHMSLYKMRQQCIKSSYV